MQDLLLASADLADGRRSPPCVTDRYGRLLIAAEYHITGIKYIVLASLLASSRPTSTTNIHTSHNQIAPSHTVATSSTTQHSRTTARTSRIPPVLSLSKCPDPPHSPHRRICTKPHHNALPGRTPPTRRVHRLHKRIRVHRRAEVLPRFRETSLRNRYSRTTVNTSARTAATYSAAVEALFGRCPVK